MSPPTVLIPPRRLCLILSMAAISFLICFMLYISIAKGNPDRHCVHIFIVYGKNLWKCTLLHADQPSMLQGMYSLQYEYYYILHFNHILIYCKCKRLSYTLKGRIEASECANTNTHKHFIYIHKNIIKYRCVVYVPLLCCCLSMDSSVSASSTNSNCISKCLILHTDQLSIS